MILNSQKALIERITIRNLFGKKSYALEVPKIEGSPSRLLLLHGDNGSGKTTLLKLVWHTLSSADNRGHRTFIAQTPFKYLTIDFVDGSSIQVIKTEGLLGTFKIRLHRQNIKSLTITYKANDELKVKRENNYLSYLDHDDVGLLEEILSNENDDSLHNRHLREIGFNYKEQQKKNEYLAFLKSVIKTPLYLADDRSLNSDDRNVDRARKNITRHEPEGNSRQLSQLAIQEIKLIIGRVNNHLRSLMIGGQNDGSANSNAIYMNVLRQLVTAQPHKQEEPQESIEGLLKSVSERSPRFEKYELVPELDTDELAKLLAQPQGKLPAHVERVAAPFLSSLGARYDALAEAQALLDSLIPAANSFFNEKELRFSPKFGLRIFTSDEQPLDIDSLSSGERQLMMLLCTTLLAGVEANLFIIDEPELSLGVDWQRKILDVLLGVTKDSNLQFVVATHSIEIISSHPESLVQLRPL